MVTIRDWRARLCCGRVLTGKDAGSFANVKTRFKLSDLWVELNGREYHAPRIPGLKHEGFDFYVSMSVEGSSLRAVCYKLITYYKGFRLQKMVFPDGREEILRLA